MSEKKELKHRRINIIKQDEPVETKKEMENHKKETAFSKQNSFSKHRFSLVDSKETYINKYVDYLIKLN